MIWSNIRSLLINNVENINLQVRWKRKPRWMPVAKSKMFRVPERKVPPLEEKLELLRLFNNYRTQVRTVRNYLMEEVKKKEEISTSDNVLLTAEEEEKEFQRREAENLNWNTKIAKEREERLRKEFEKSKNIALQKIELSKERQEEWKRKIEEIIEKEKEKSKTFITKDKLDKAIEYALANPVDYNFAIDLDGKIHSNKENDSEKEQKQSV